MEAAHIIRESVARVSELRHAAATDGNLMEASRAIKRFQARRFAGTYADLLASPTYRGATRFFLEELYSEKDYSQRDEQFARIAGALQTYFPEQVVSTAVALAQLHALTEQLDHQMAAAWLAQSSDVISTDTLRYIFAWKSVGRPGDRARQLSDVLQVGEELDRLTRKTGLRMMLRMMRKPAEVAGLGSLQSFLESGFDTFAEMAGRGAKAREFLEIIRKRETAWLADLYGDDSVTCETKLAVCLGKTP
ncbi:MAG: hypothetical protein KGN32_12025 [Burkholderiales bacterium]|nr:hypothetical protein [Burkholderiales bacterium]